MIERKKKKEKKIEIKIIEEIGNWNARDGKREREKERAARCSISCDEQPRDPPRWYLDRLYAHEKRNLFTTIKRNLREGKCRKAALKRKPVTLLQVQRTHD